MSPSSTTADLVCRPVRADEVERVLPQIEGWLGMSQKLVRTYPQVFGPHRSADLIGVFAGEELLSHAAVRAVRVRTPQGVVRVAMVGSVVTAPSQRGQGLASELLRQIQGQAQQVGQDVLILWSDRWDFYERLGFAASGEQHEVVIRCAAGRSSGGSLHDATRRAQAGDLPDLLRLHARKPTAVDRNLADWAVLLSAATTTMVLERHGTITAYACCGKGLDFDGWWHELGGDDDEVATLVHESAAKLGQSRTTVMLPPYRSRLLEHLDPWIEAARCGASALHLPLTDRGRTAFFVDGLDSI